MSVEQLIREVQALKAEVASLKNSKDDEVMVEGKEEEEGEGAEGETPSWGALLKAVSVEPQSEGAQFLCQVLSTPLDQRDSEKALPCYKHYPQTCTQGQKQGRQLSV